MSDARVKAIDLIGYRLAAMNDRDREYALNFWEKIFSQRKAVLVNV